ncbi:MBL fold metallo-hydrolase [Colwellia sp. BRX10-4]|jgi:L-ascorbate metabolism protein UlaG (beta-lactamase superfamily)|uniref:MBL fold metallo-hydrolase n=1 Tax=Colwellia sp. BRX10-4 TaxID=2759843 RepID=UPI0015F4DFC1|nr:MBL fold metallo-hydrolase [Colwellia sp. BRX10-4]MBA6398999.1 MBL fold metallo-hydrolase [Colwellia sp. BRX10-4]
MKKLSALIFTIFLSSCVSQPYAKTNAPFDGVKFDNIEPFDDKSIFDLLSWKIKAISESTPWPDEIYSKQFKPSSQRSVKPIITVISHASVLIQIDNLNILTDPHYSLRASPVQFAGPKRVVKPGIAFDDLPSIDIVLISHNHYDHLDLDTLKRLNERDAPKFVAGLKTKSFLKKNGIEAGVDLDWWQNITANNTKITFVPSQHWSARGLFDKREMLWGGFYIENNYKIYFAGDTGYGKFFKKIKDKLGAPDLSLIPIGAYEPRWFMKYAHLNPKDSLQAFRDLESKKMIGIHFGTFKLTDEGYNDPIESLNEEIKRLNMDPLKVIIPTFGKPYSI